MKDEIPRKVQILTQIFLFKAKEGQKKGKFREKFKF